MIVARRKDRLVIRRKRDLVEIVPRVGRVIANQCRVFFHLVGCYAVEAVDGGDRSRINKGLSLG